MGRSRAGAAMAFLDWIGIVRALFGMLHADGDVLAAAAGFTHAMRPNGAVQCAGDNLRIGSGVVEHLLFNGLCTLLQRAVHAHAELQIGRHVGQIVAQIIKALQFHRHGHFLPAEPPASRPRSTARCRCAWPGRRPADYSPYRFLPASRNPRRTWPAGCDSPCR